MKILNEQSFFKKGDINLEFVLQDSSGIGTNSIVVEFDSVKTFNYTFNTETNILGLNIFDVKPGKHEIRIIAANKNGNHNFPFRNQIVVTE